MGALSSPESWKYGYTGALETCVEAKLVDVPELGYFVNNDPPQGELLLRGPSITSGYLDREEETAALFDAHGWLKTGDIGQFDKQGLLKIIDRVKNLVKTLNGEYIAIEKVVSSFNLIDNSLKRLIIHVILSCLSAYMQIPIAISLLQLLCPLRQL